MRKQAAAKFAPLDYAQHEAATTAIEYVMQAGTALSARYGKLMKAVQQSPMEAAAEKLKALASG